jgi:myxalamid-type polyketide synthase MxaB
LHAKGRISQTGVEATVAPVELDEVQARCTDEVSVSDLYDRLRREALQYGPCFRGVKQLYRGEWEVLGKVELPRANRDEAQQHLLHPALLDSCLHVMAGLVAHEQSSREGLSPFLPVGVKRLRLMGAAGPEVWSYVKVRAEGNLGKAVGFTADLHLCRPDGQQVAVLQGLRMQRVPRSTLLAPQQKESVDWLYEVCWLPAPAAGEPQRVGAGTCLVFADTGGVAEALARNLSDAGTPCALVWPGNRYELLEDSASPARRYRIRPESPDDFARLLREVFDGSVGGPATTRFSDGLVVHLWSLAAPCDEADAFASAHRLACGSVLHLVQALSMRQAKARLCLATRGGQTVGQAGGNIDQLAQAPLWGLGRVIAMEHPELRCVRVDLDPQTDCTSQVRSLLDELATVNADDQVAYRDGTRYVARLVRLDKIPGPGLSLPERPFRLRMTALGSADNFEAVPLDRRDPAPGEVEIEVDAAGLNFRDALRALGMLEEYERKVGKRLGIASVLEAPLGFECAGRVVKAGEGVEHLLLGDEVLGIAYGSLASHVTVAANWVIRKPPSLNAVQAATIPMAFTTAAYALEHLAQISSGEKLLIHAAAGGVGQAAVRIARAAGVEIFATASPSKWELLKSQGIVHVMNSRSLDFREQVMQATDGRGVDVVLNSFSGDFIPASLAVLHQGGRFVEIGQLGIWDREQMAAERPDVSYYPFDLDDEERLRPGLIQSLLAELMPRFESGGLDPVPHQAFPVQQVGDAVRYLTQTRRVGKGVVAISPETVRASCPGTGGIRGDATYLITGGLGGLGFHVARWLIEHGARHLVLCSRSGSETPAGTDAINRLQATGAKVRVMQADVARRQDVEQLLETIRATLPPLRGVVHAAGVLDDGMLQFQNWDRFERVMRPKVAGAWHLHQLTRDLDFFVLFSSGVGLVGAHGQGNYASANAFLDGLAEYRRGQGLPAVSIAWGPWSDVGMTARMDQRARARMAEAGLQGIRLEDGLDMFGRLIRQAPPLLAAMRIDWPRLAATLPPAASWADLAHASATNRQPAAAVLEQLRSTPPGDRMEMLIGHLRSEVAAVLGWKSAEQIGPRQKLFDLGMDSLTSVELRHRLESNLGCSLPLTVAFDYPNVEALADYIADRIELVQEEPAAVEPPPEQLDERTRRLAEMSDEEVESLLADKFKDLL